MTKQALDAAISATLNSNSTTGGGVVVPMITPTALGGVQSSAGCAGILLYSDGKVAATYANGENKRWSPWHREGEVHTVKTLTLDHLDPRALQDIYLAPVKDGETNDPVPGLGLIKHPGFAGVFGHVGGVRKGSKWTPAQPMAIWNTVQSIVSAGGTLESVQWLRPGRLVLDGQLPIDAKGFRGDRHVVRWAFTIDYTGQGADAVMITIVRVVCCNTEAAAQRDAKRSGGFLKVHHTAGIVDRYELDVPEFLGRASASVAALAEQKAKLNDRKLKKGERDAYFKAVLGELGLGEPDENTPAKTANRYDRSLEALVAAYDEERENAKKVDIPVDSLRVAYESVTSVVSKGAVVTTKRDANGNAREYDHRYILTGARNPTTRSLGVMSGEKQRKALLVALGLCGEKADKVKVELQQAARI